MKSFAETQKGKRVKKKTPEAGKVSDDEEEKKPPADNQNDVLSAREQLRRRLTQTPTKDKPQTPTELVMPEESKGFQRRWVTVNDKVDKKALDSVNVSEVKGDGNVDLEREMEKYLGGDD